MLVNSFHTSDYCGLSTPILPVWTKDACLFTMIDYMQHSSMPKDGPIVLLSPSLEHQLDTPSGQVAHLPLLSQLKRHDKIQSNQRFSVTTFDCSICLEAMKGRSCLKLQRCAHVFCTPCLTDYFNLCITEGSVGNVHCPDPECTAARAKIDKKASIPTTELPGSLDLEELQSIVGEKQTARFAKLQRNQLLEQDPTVTHCPRPSCQAPVLQDPDEAYEKLRECQDCGFTFCAFCHRTYHGPASPCVLSHAESVASQYIEGTEEDQKRVIKQYGSKVVLKIVAQYQEEKKNSEWLESNATSCPGCNAHIEKTEGCNKMVCGKVCGSVNSPTTPLLNLTVSRTSATPSSVIAAASS